MKYSIYVFSLWFSVISLGLWVGGTLFHMLVVQPLWTGDPPTSVQFFFTQTKFNETIWNFFGPPWMVARLLPLFLCILFGWDLAEGKRRYLIAAGVCWIIITAFTLIYVYPINDVLFRQAGGNNAPEVVKELIRTWLIADRLRFVIGTAGYVCLLYVFRSKA